MDEDFIKVLWIEDDPIIREAYHSEAEYYGLNLCTFDCWDKAKAALENDFSSWEAIILDAKCKQHTDSADNATKFLSEALSGLRFLFAQNKRTINWYILSAGSEEEINDSILDDRKAWDGDWPKLYYSKATDRTELFKRISNHVKTRPKEIQVKTNYFRDVFEAIREAELDERIEMCMKDLLIPIVFPDSVSAVDYNNRLTEARITVEYIFRGMTKMGLLPLIQNNNKKGSINLYESCKVISGKPWGKCHYNVVNNVFPGILYQNLLNIVNIVGSSVHSKSDEIVLPADFCQYNRGTGGTSYLLKSFAFQLCDVILWYNNYIREHNDPIVNSKNWEEQQSF
ncbi:MAG: hypothetical protein IKN31_03675 [Bacteroidales bacterium]|nr:hypothetical protein [Bacteroidales bacterium]